MPRSRHATAARPHARAKADARVGQAAIEGDPWAARIRQVVLDECHPWQRDGILDPSKRLTYLVGRGGGKTTCLKGRYLIELTSTTSGSWIYACPTLGDAIELLWEPLKHSCEALGIMDDCTWMEAPREGGKILIVKRTGSRVKLIGVDDKKQINRCRGRAFNGVGCDEVGFWGNDVIKQFVTKVIQPRIGERAGWIAMASSPGEIPVGYFWERTADGQALHRPYELRDRPEFAHWTPSMWSSHAWDLGAVVKQPQAAKRYPALVALRESHLEIKRAEGYSDDNPIWQREYCGRWARDDTATVFRFEETRNTWDPAPGETGEVQLKQAIAKLREMHPSFGWHFVISGDKGTPRKPKEGEVTNHGRAGDPYAVNVFAFSPSDPSQTIYHVYSLERRGLYARLIAQLVLGADEKAPNGCMPHEKPGGLLAILGWPDAMVFDSDAALVEELSNVYGLTFERPDKAPSYKAGVIELANSDLHEGRIKAIKGSPLHTQLAELQWAEQDSGALKEDPSQPNHSTDTMIYGRKKIAELFESGVVVQESVAPTASYSDPMGLDGGHEPPPPERRTRPSERVREPDAAREDLFETWLSGQSDEGDDFL